MVEPTCLSGYGYLLGIASTQYSENMYFAAGAIVSSFMFFYSLGFGAQFLSDFLSIHFRGGYWTQLLD